MKTFLIFYTLHIYQYMNDGFNKEGKTIIVEAESLELAEKTLIAYWDNKSDQYGTSYIVNNIEVVETINQIDFIKK